MTELCIYAPGKLNNLLITLSVSETYADFHFIEKGSCYYTYRLQNYYAYEEGGEVWITEESPINEKLQELAKSDFDELPQAFSLPPYRALIVAACREYCKNNGLMGEWEKDPLAQTEDGQSCWVNDVLDNMVMNVVDNPNESIWFNGDDWYVINTDPVTLMRELLDGNKPEITNTTA